MDRMVRLIAQQLLIRGVHMELKDMPEMPEMDGIMGYMVL